MAEPPNHRDPGESFQFIADVIDIFPPSSFIDSSDRVSLVTSAGRFGLLFISNQISIQVFKTSELIDNKNTTPIACLEGRGAITHITASCDGQTLFVGTVVNYMPFAYFYDICSLTLGPNAPAPFYTVPLSTEIGSRIASLAWNPCDSSCIAVAITTGDLSLLKIKESSVEFVSKNGIGANTVTWSAKGKQLAVGKKDATIALFKPDLTLVRAIEAPPVEGVGPIIDITWFTNTEFFVGYLIQNTTPVLLYVNAAKGKPSMFFNFNDVAYSTETGKPVSYYTAFISEWNLLFVASSNSLDVGVVGKPIDPDKSDCKWCTWFPDDNARAAMQNYDIVHETYPRGVAVDFTSQKLFPSKDEQIRGPFPVLIALSNKGVLNVFHVENKLTEVPNLSKTSEDLPPCGQRTPEQFGQKIVSEPTITNQTAFQPQLPYQSAFNSIAKKDGGASSSDKSFAFSTPIKPMASQPSIISGSVISPFSSSATGPSLSISNPFISKPLSISGEGGASNSNNSLSNTLLVPSPKKSSFSQSPLPTSAATSFPFSIGTSVPAGSPSVPQPVGSLPPFSFSFSKPSTSIPQSGIPVPQSAAQSVFPVTQSSFSVPQSAFSVPQPPLSATQSSQPSLSLPQASVHGFQSSLSVQQPSLSIQQPALSVSQPILSVPQPSVSIPPPSQSVPQPSQSGLKPSLSVPQSPLPSSQSAPKIPRQSLIRQITEERNQFERELKDLFNSNDALIYKIGTTEEESSIGVTVANIKEWITAMRKTTEEQNEEVGQLHQNTLESLATYEDANSHRNINYKSRNQIYLQLRPLDPYSQRRIEEIRSKYQYLLSQICEVNTKLDLQWEEYCALKKPKRRDHIPTTENLYRSVLNLHNKRISSEKQLESLHQQLKKLNISYMQLSPSSFVENESKFNRYGSSPSTSSLNASSWTKSVNKSSPKKISHLQKVLSQRVSTPVRVHSISDTTYNKTLILNGDGSNHTRPARRGKIDLEQSFQFPNESEKISHSTGFNITSTGFKTHSTVEYEDISEPNSPKKGGTPGSSNPLAALSCLVGKVSEANDDQKLKAGFNFSSAAMPKISPKYHDTYRMSDQNQQLTHSVDSSRMFGTGCSAKRELSSGVFKVSQPISPPAAVTGLLGSSQNANKSAFTGFTSKGATFQINFQTPLTESPSGMNANAAETTCSSKHSLKGNSGNTMVPTTTATTGLFVSDGGLFQSKGLPSAPLSDKSSPLLGMLQSGVSIGGSVSYPSLNSDSSKGNFVIPNVSSSFTPNSLGSSELKFSEGITSYSPFSKGPTAAQTLNNFFKDSSNQLSVSTQGSTAASAVTSSSIGNILDSNSSTSSASTAVSQSTGILPSFPNIGISSSLFFQEDKSSKSLGAVSPTTSTPSQSIFGVPSTVTSSIFGEKIPSSSPTMTTGASGTTLGQRPAINSSSLFSQGTTTSMPSLFGGVSLPNSTTLSQISSPSLFGQASSSSPLYSQGTPTSTPSIFGLGTLGSSSIPVTSSCAVSTTSNITTGSSSPIVQPSVSSSAFGLNFANSSSLFGQPSTTGTSSLFSQLTAASSTSTDQTSTTSSSGLSQATTASIFSQGGAPSLFGEAPKTTSLFGEVPKTSSLFGDVPKTTSLFGEAPKTTSLFGEVPKTTSLFGDASKTSSSLFGQGTAPGGTFSVYGSVGNSQSVFGTSSAPSTASQSNFVLTTSTTTTTTTTSQSIFGNQPSIESNQKSPFGTSSIFGQATNTTNAGNTLLTSALGQSTVATTNSGLNLSTPSTSIFGQASGQTSTLFGSQSSSVFGQEAKSGTSVFGNSASSSNTPTNSIFGGAPTPKSTSLFSSTFGQASSAASPFAGGTMFSGLGKAPSKENENKNVFGAVTGASSPQTNLFGGGDGSSIFGGTGNVGASSSQTAAAAFSPIKTGSTFGGASFGGSQSTTPNTGIFGGGGVFGGSPAAEGSSKFGGPPTFGGSPAFGGTPFGGRPSFGTSPTFGGGPSIFGGTISSTNFGGGESTTFSANNTSGTSAGFSSFASAGSTTFGSLAGAAQGSTDTTGFGQLSQQSPGGLSGSGTGGNAFTNWR